jgi:1-acyl-sn-glycerol-3-phosphate acyltransferase
LRERCTPAADHPQAPTAIFQHHEVAERRDPRLVHGADVDPAVVAMAARTAGAAVELHSERGRGHGELYFVSMPGSFPLAMLAVAETLRITVPTVLDAVSGKLTREACDRRLSEWAGRVVREAGIDLDVRGVENIRTDEPLVLMSNHQSHYDIPVLFRSFPGSMRMVAKTELHRIPLFGRALRAAEFVEVDRSNKERARASIAVAKERLASGVNVWIAPEGTRSVTGKLGPLKKGGFVLARDMNARILPITIDGTRHVLPPHTAKVQRGVKVTVTFHPLVDPSAFDKEALVAEVARLIGSALPEELR